MAEACGVLAAPAMAEAGGVLAAPAMAEAYLPACRGGGAHASNRVSACLPEAAAGQAASLLPARQGPAAVLAPAMAVAADCARESSASKSMQK